MPIYEFFCQDCNTVFNFLSRRVNTEARPLCPRCQKRPLKRQLSGFATLGKAKGDGSEEALAGLDETRLLQTIAELGREAEKLNEEDPRQMAGLMRKFSEKTGLNLGDGMEEALARLEAGDDPDRIEKEMGDLLETAEPGAFEGKSRGKTGPAAAPQKDDTLYEL